MTDCGKNKLNGSKVVVVGAGKRSRLAGTVIGLMALTERPVLSTGGPINYGTIGIVDTSYDPEAFAHSRQTYLPKKSNKKSKRDIFKKR